MSALVVLDIDDVLTQTRERVYHAMLATTGIDIHWQHWDEYDLRPRYRLTHEELMDAFNQHDLINEVHLEEGAREFIASCKEAGCRVATLTARGWHPQAEAHTWAYFERHQLAIDELHVCTPSECKSDWIKRLGPVHLYVDDHLNHILNVQEKTANVTHLALMDRPWNQGEHGVRRVFSLHDCLSLL